MLTGKQIHLVPLSSRHLAKTRDWANNPELNAGILRVLPVTEIEQQIWFENVCTDSGKIVFAIHLLENDEHVGNCGFYNLDHLHRRAELWLLIGEKNRHGKGLGQEATRLLLAYGFDFLNLNRIYLYVNQDHSQAVNLYEKAGFCAEGIMRKHYFIQGKYQNVLIMSILKDDYETTK